MEILKPTNIRKWDDLVLASDSNSIFHTSMWQKVLTETYHYKPKYICHIENNKFTFMLPLIEISSSITGRRGVSLPFTDFCEPIIESGFNILDITDMITDLGKKSGWKYVELRGGNIFSEKDQKSTSFYNHRLDLDQGADDLYSGFSTNTRRNIKKAVRQGVTVRKSSCLESVRDYYYLHCLTRKRHGIPPQSFNFFRKIHEHIISKGHGFILLASYNQRHIAGAVYFHFGDMAIYKFGASDFRYKEHRPNNLVMWEAIKWYAQNKYRHFDFGRTEYNNNGLRNFKAGWGGIESIIDYFKYDLHKNCFLQENGNINKQIQLIFRLMPISINRVAGNLFYKHVG